jgi:hypothetical protein
VELQATHFNPYLIPFYGFPDLVIRPATTVQLLAKSELILLSLEAARANRPPLCLIDKGK